MTGKTLAILKKIDLTGQFAALLLPAVLHLIVPSFGAFSGFIDGVWHLGKWQVVSFLIHFVFRRTSWISRQRGLYAVALFVFFVMMALTFFVPGLFYINIIALPVAALMMAGFYLFITIDELSAISRIGRITTRTTPNNFTL